MRQSTKNRIRNLVITEKVTKFVAKVSVVENNLVMNGRIHLSYFNELSGVMSPALIEPKYLMLAPKQEQFYPFK